MNTLFYDHLVDWQRFRKFLASQNLDTALVEDLEAELDELLHHKILHVSLDLLPVKKREKYFADFLHNPQLIKHLDDLLRHDASAMERIRKAADEVIDEVIQAVKISMVP